MGNFPWEAVGIALTTLGVVIPTLTFLWEFVIVGRKRLGYRVQMDTTAASDEANSPYAGALQQLQANGARLVDPSFVLLRIENNGATHVDTSDYAVLDDDKVGIRITFPGRRVVGMVLTELSDEFLRPSFGEGSGLRVRDGVIELPKVPLNARAHYKVLVALERAPQDSDGRLEQFKAPKVVGGIKGGVAGGRIKETRSRTGTSGQAIAMGCFLVLVILAQQVISFTRDDPAPLDCATGDLVVTGSTAFAPVLREAADAYRGTCPDAGITVRAEGSVAGLRELDRVAGQAGPDVLAFSDGEKGDGYPQLLPRPIAFFLFTLVINRDAGVQDLTPGQIQQLFDGRITNWKDVGGNDQPVRLIGRHSDSGTRRAFETRILGSREPADTSDDCVRLADNARPGVILCERGSTDEVLDAVAGTSSALGYSEVGAASGRRDVLPVRINGHPATLEGADYGAYPFWETEYAYTYGEPRADSLAASFLRYLTNEVGKDIVRSHGSRPCAELQNPVLCRPT